MKKSQCGDEMTGRDEGRICCDWRRSRRHCLQVRHGEWSPCNRAGHTEIHYYDYVCRQPFYCTILYAIRNLAFLCVSCLINHKSEIRDDDIRGREHNLCLFSNHAFGVDSLEKESTRLSPLSTSRSWAYPFTGISGFQANTGYKAPSSAPRRPFSSPLPRHIFSTKRCDQIL